MVEEKESDVESATREAWQRGEMDQTATIVYEAYGTEIYGFLLAQFRGDPTSADDVFSQFNEDFWCGLPAFRWRCSIRAWCYALARSAASRHRRSPHNQQARRAPASQGPWLAAIARARTSTLPHLRTEVKDEFQRLREKLAPEDVDLLILRVDRNLPWRDIAHAMLAADEPADDDTVHRKEAALRQRFSEIKRRLKTLAIESGLLPSKED